MTKCACMSIDTITLNMRLFVPNYFPCNNLNNASLLLAGIITVYILYVNDISLLLELLANTREHLLIYAMLCFRCL